MNSSMGLNYKEKWWVLVVDILNNSKTVRLYFISATIGHVQYYCIYGLYIVRVASLVDATRWFEGVGESVN